MKKVKLVLLVLVASISICSAQQGEGVLYNTKTENGVPVQYPKTSMLTYTGMDTYLFEACDPFKTFICEVKKGEEIMILSHKMGQLKVSYKGKIGYIPVYDLITDAILIDMMGIWYTNFKRY